MESPRSALDPRPLLQSTEELPGSYCENNEPCKSLVAPVHPKPLYALPPIALVDCFLRNHTASSSQQGDNNRDKNTCSNFRTSIMIENPVGGQTADDTRCVNKIQDSQPTHLVWPNQIQSSSDDWSDANRANPVAATGWAHDPRANTTVVDPVGNLRRHSTEDQIGTLSLFWSSAERNQPQNAIAPQFSPSANLQHLKLIAKEMASHRRPPGQSPPPSSSGLSHHQHKPMASSSNDEYHRRCRSRAIAIKPSRRRRREDAISEPSLAAQLEYDCATWRLYNRIIEHRQKNPVSSDYHEASNNHSTVASRTFLTSEMMNANPLESSSVVHVVGASPKTSVSFAGDDAHDGEIFDLEL